MTSNDQTPTRLDFARAAALIAHHIRQDVAGVTKIIRTAEADRRLSALLWAVADTAIAEDGNTIGTPEGIRALGELALDMATHATDEAPGTDQRAHGRDIKRAAMFFRYRQHNDSDGANSVLCEAEEAGRATALIGAAAALAYMAADSTLATPGGLAGLERVARTLNRPDTPGAG